MGKPESEFDDQRLKKGHAGLKITQEQYEETIRILIKVLTDFKVQFADIKHIGDTIESKKTPIRRALLTNNEERFIRELILQWKLGRVNQKYFNDKFGVNISERYSSILSEWKRRGDLSEENGELVLSRSALLKVDTLLHSLFLPRHRNAERYV